MILNRKRFNIRNGSREFIIRAGAHWGTHGRRQELILVIVLVIVLVIILVIIFVIIFEIILVIILSIFT